MDGPEDDIGIVLPAKAVRSIFEVIAEAYLVKRGVASGYTATWEDEARGIAAVLIDILDEVEQLKGGGGADPRMN